MQRLQIDTSHSGVYFTARHMIVAKVRGAFTQWSGSIDYDPKQVELSKVLVEIAAASIDTREPKRDAHLRSADFFDAENHPTLTFQSTKVERVSDGLRIIGDLTMRGVTHPVTLQVEEQGAANDPWGNTRLLWTARTSVNRKDWGLNWNQVLEAGGVLVSEKIELELEVQALPAAAG